MVTTDDIRTVALSLPRTEEALVRDQVKFRVGRIVYVALSRDELSMGFAFPKDERAASVAANPGKFFMPTLSDLRYNWVQVCRKRSTRQRCGNSSSTRGAWSCRSELPPSI